MSNNNNAKLKAISKLVGNTPLICIKYRFQDKVNHIFAKAEWFNLTGSVKDRPALEIIKQGYISKKLSANKAIIETSSGNMGISLCAIGTMLKHPVIIFMPKNMSKERKKIIKALGGKIVLTNDFLSALQKAESLAKTTDSFLSLQFENKANEKAHQKTGREILKQLKNKSINAFTCGVGTSGTLMGIGTMLKKYNSNINIVAIEPKSSPILKLGKKSGEHIIQGISDDFIPQLYNKSVVDEIIDVSNEDSLLTAQKLAKQLGLGVGISSGANVFGAICLKHNCPNGEVVTILPDDNKKYLSTVLTKHVKNKALADEIEFISYCVIK